MTGTSMATPIENTLRPGSTANLVLWGGSILVALVMWELLPAIVVALGWLTLGLLLIEVGVGRRSATLRVQGYVGVTISVVRLFFLNFTAVGYTLFPLRETTWIVSHRFLTVAPTIASLYYLVTVLQTAYAQGITRDWERRIVILFSHTAVFLTVVLLRFEMGRTLAVVGWALYFLLLLFLGIRRHAPRLRFQAYGVSLLTFVRGVTTNFFVAENFYGESVPVAAAIVVIVCMWLAQWMSVRMDRTLGTTVAQPRLVGWLDRRASWWFSAFALVLMILVGYRYL
jgi:hypothetical protein